MPRGIYRAKVTYDRARELLVYDPDTGILGWRYRRAGQPPPEPGRQAGYIGADGYWKVRLDGVAYQAHRLIWLLMTGSLPDGDLDHANLDKADNRWANLRPASHHDNMRNVRSRKRDGSPSKLKGAYLETGHDDQWFSAITINGKSHRLGRFQTPEEAHAAYCKAAKKAFGAFARTK